MVSGSSFKAQHAQRILYRPHRLILWQAHLNRRLRGTDMGCASHSPHAPPVAAEKLSLKQLETREWLDLDWNPATRCDGTVSLLLLKFEIKVEIQNIKLFCLILFDLDILWYFRYFMIYSENILFDSVWILFCSISASSGTGSPPPRPSGAAVTAVTARAEAILRHSSDRVVKRRGSEMVKKWSKNLSKSIKKVNIVTSSWLHLLLRNDAFDLFRCLVTRCTSWLRSRT